MLDTVFNPQFNVTYACTMYSVCTYCYAKEFAKKTAKLHMDVSAFEQAIVWLKSFQVRDVVLIGGEPTLHPQLADLLKVLRKHDVSCRVFTNGLSEPGPIRALCEDTPVKEVFFHYDEAYWAAGGKNRETFLRNLDYCKARGKTLVLRWNITEQDFRYREVVRLAERHGAAIGYSVSAPSSGNESYIQLDGVKSLVPRLREFVLLARDRGVRLLLGRPLPLCAFPEEELLFWKDNADLKGVCTPINDLTFNPDMTMQLCSVLFNTVSEHPVGSLDELSERIAALRVLGEELKKTPTMPMCRECPFFPDECQGGCLSYKVCSSGDRHGVSGA